jgi:hypothetical protein
MTREKARLQCARVVSTTDRRRQEIDTIALRLFPLGLELPRSRVKMIDGHLETLLNDFSYEIEFTNPRAAVEA